VKKLLLTGVMLLVVSTAADAQSIGAKKMPGDPYVSSGCGSSWAICRYRANWRGRYQTSEYKRGQQTDSAYLQSGNRVERRLPIGEAVMKRLFLTGVAALFLPTGTAPAEDTRKWIWRCALVHTPSEEQEAEAEHCCKRWPNAPHCNGDYTRAMSLPRCAKLPHLANIKCAERILLKINPRPR
jgi:hypothetical protein